MAEVTWDGDCLVLTSGKRVPTIVGVIGLDADEGIEIVTGFDKILETEDLDPLTIADKIEIADLMIKRWTELKEELGKNG